MQEVKHNIAKTLRRSMEVRHQTLMEFSEELNISKTALRQYLRGTANPTIETLATISDKLGMTPAELIADDPAGVSQATLLLHAAQEIGSLPTEQQREGIRLFLALVDLFSQ